jgi:hypothetical protein
MKKQVHNSNYPKGGTVWATPKTKVEPDGHKALKAFDLKDFVDLKLFRVTEHKTSLSESGFTG